MNPPLTLVEEIELLSLDDKTGAHLPLLPEALGYGLAGAILADLEMAGRIATSGKVVEVNRDLEMHPELVNEDAYGRGWLAVIAAESWEAESARLLEPQAYLEVMQAQARRELEQ